MELLAKIFGSRSRLKVLRLFLFNKDSLFSAADIRARTKLSKEVIRRELSDLLATGFLRVKGKRSKAEYQSNPRFEHLTALDAFIRETTSVRPKDIISELRRAGTLRFVALSGHFTGVLESQIDLLVVGDDLNERVLASAVHSLEADLGREIRFASFATNDFRYRLGVYDRLLRDVFDYPHRLLMDKIGL